MKETDFYSSVFHSVGDQICVIDEKGVIVDVNRAWINFGVCNGVEPEETYSSIGTNYLDAINAAIDTGDEAAVTALKGIREVMDGVIPAYRFEYPCHSPTEDRWFTMLIAPLSGDEQRRFVISHHNITKRVVAENKALEAASLDALTSLLNRKAFESSLEKECLIGKKDQTPISLMVFDINQFKEYNNLLGYKAGDECLIAISDILESHASQRPKQYVSRIDGDEFAVAFGDTDIDTAQAMGQSIQEQIERLGLFVEDKYRVTVSMGLASAVPESVESASSLLNVAERSLDEAKSARLEGNQLFAR